MTDSKTAPAPDYTGLFSLRGKTVLVTGGCGILGTQFSAGLAAHGANIVIVDLDGAAVESAARIIEERYSVQAIGLVADVSDPASVATMVEAAMARFGRIDALLNNAATKTSDIRTLMQPVETASFENWREAMSVNLDGMFLVAQAVGRTMRAAGGGSIIQTSSIYGLVGPDLRIYEGSYYLGGPITNPLSYSTAKAGVIGMTRHLATEWAKDGVRVNALVPGGVESGQNDIFKQKYSARIPMGRMARAEEMVGAVVWLASGASSYVTGQVIAVDGGMTATF